MEVEQFDIPLQDNLDLKGVSESREGGCSEPISNQVVEEQHDEGRRDTLGILRKVLLLWYEVLKISSLSGMNSSIGSPVSNVRLINVQSTFNSECLIILQWHLQCIKGCSWHQYLGI